MNDELREKVAKELWRMYCDECGVEDNWDELDDYSYRHDYRERADAILRLFASLLVKAQREAFVACHRWRGSFSPTDEQADAEAVRRYPDA